MKIAIWASRYLPFVGGLEMLSHALAKQLTKMGHELLVITDTGSSLLYKEYVVEGIKVVALPWDFATWNHNLSLVKHNIEKARQVLHRFNPDIVNIHGWYQALTFSQIRVLYQIPFCLSLHGLMLDETYQTNACLQLWNEVKAVSVVSNALHDLVLTTLQLKPRPLRVIHNGMCLSHFSKPPLPPKPYRIAMVGRLSSEKNFDIAFRALKEIRKKNPQVTLCVVGGGPMWRELLDLRSLLQLEDSIEMTGFVEHDQVYKYIDEAMVVWIPSSFESFSLTALETALRKRPVIASQVQGLKEVVDDGNTGIFIEPDNLNALVQATELFFQNNRGIQMGLNAYTRARELFSIEQCAEKYLQMYRSV